jgi:hypothetical protein
MAVSYGVKSGRDLIMVPVGNLTYTGVEKEFVVVPFPSSPY